MKKLSKLQESVWGNISKRAEGNLERKEDLYIVTIDGVKYDIGDLLLTVPEFEEKTGEEWFGLGFDTPRDKSTVISQNEDFEFSTKYDYMASNYDVYVLHKYIDMKKEEHIAEMIKEGNIDTMNNPPIQKILEKYLNKIYDDYHMSEYADYVINSLAMTDFSVNLCFDVSTHDCYPDDVEYDKNDILDSNTIMYPVIDNWYIGLLKELREEYEKLGWTESMSHIIDPYDSPTHTDEICFLKLKEGAKRNDEDINESVWGNISKRAEGTNVRKEDDINNLDRDGLYDYLTSHYKNTNSFVPIYISEIFDMISVPFLLVHHQDCVHLDFKKNEVSIPYTSPYKVNGLFSKLTKEFSIRSDSDTKPSLYIISPKDGSEVTNTFFIEVIDFLIDNIPDSFERGVKRIVNESVWGNISKRAEGAQERKEDIPVKEQDYKYWWRNIPLDNAPKYKKEELRLWDFLYDLIIWKIEKTMNIKTPETIRIYFKNEDAWYISIYHNTAHGSDNYTMECNGTHGYNPQKYSEMNIAEKRGIKYRLEKKKFYIYTSGQDKWTEYILTEEPTRNGKKGIPML